MNDGLTFAAIDVETANPQRASICSVGLTLVRAGVVEATYSWLCQPPTGAGEFSPWNVRIHGITADDVATEEPFAARLKQVVDLIGTRPVVAHNAAFDMSAIRNACEMSEIALPAWQYGCTLRWSKSILRLDKYKLPAVAKALEVKPGNHHDAADDARVAAEIAVALTHRVHASDLDALARSTGLPFRSSHSRSK